MLVVRGLEQLGGALVADDHAGAEDFRRTSGGGEARGDLGLDRVYDETAANGGAWCDGCIETFDLYHRIAHGRAGVEDEVGEVGELFAVGAARGGRLRVRAADERHDADAALLELLGHLDRHDVAAARGHDERGVARVEGVVAQNAFGEAADVFEKHRLPLAIRADDQVVEREREFDDRVEAGKRAVARPHLLDHDARVAGAEEVDHASGADGAGEPVGGGGDGGRLGGDGVNEAARLGQVGFSGSHAGEVRA